MEFKFNKKPADDAGTPPEDQGQQDKGRQTTLLVLLLLLLGIVGYLYFFTGLIRPQESPPKPPTPPQVVKQPLPPKGEVQPQTSVMPAEPAKPGTPPAAPMAAAKPAPASPAVSPAKPAAPPVASAAKPEAKQSAATVPATKAAQPAAATPAKTSTAPAVGKPAPAQTADKQAVASKPASPKTAKVPKGSGPWTLVVGLYTVEGKLAEDMAKLKKAGLTPTMTMGPKKPAAMHRLQYGAFADKAEAQKAVEMLKRQTGDGFMVQKGDKHEVFAGSYALLSGAQSEQQRLAASGIKVSVQKTTVQISSRKLTAGTFTDRTAAEAALKKVKTAVSGSPVLE